MSWEPTTIALADYNIAKRPSLGAELKVYLSPAETYELASIEMSASGTGAIDIDASNALIQAGDPSDLVLVVDGELQSAVNTVVTLNVTDEDDAARTVVATIKPPAWVNNQSKSFQEGYGADLVISLAGKKVKTIVSIESIVGGSRGSKMKILRLPDPASFTLVGCTTDKDFTTKTRPAKPIACGLDGSAFVTFGRSEPGKLTVTQKYVTYADGLARFVGRRCTAKAVLEKSGILIVETLVFGNFILNGPPRFPDGDDEATLQAEGMYEFFGAFVAK